MVELIVTGVICLALGGAVYRQFDKRLTRLEDMIYQLLLKNGIEYNKGADKTKGVKHE